MTKLIAPPGFDLRTVKPVGSLNTDYANRPRILNIKFHEFTFSGSRVVPCGPTEGQTKNMKLTFDFHNFANAHKTVDAVYFCVSHDCQNNFTDRTFYWKQTLFSVRYELKGVNVSGRAISQEVNRRSLTAEARVRF
jgi:hypothetical protein